MSSLVAACPQTKQLVVIDASVDDCQALIDGVIEDATVIVLDGDRDGIQQLTQIIQEYGPINQLHIVAHGASGCLYLGNTELNLWNLGKYSLHLASWFFSSTQPHPSIFLYSCHVAAGAAGAEFLKQLHYLTGASIAASTTPIGNAAKGGNWELDWAIGVQKQEDQSIFQPNSLLNYPHTLAEQYAIEWTKRIYSPEGEYDNSNGVAVDAFGNIYVVGYTEGSISGPSWENQGQEYNIPQILIQKYSSTGTLLWGKQFGNLGQAPEDPVPFPAYADAMGGVGVDANGNVYVAGIAEGSLASPNPETDDDAWIGKFQSDGSSTSWIRQLEEAQYAYAVSVDATGNTYVLVEADRSSGVMPGNALIKFSSTGNIVWSKTVPIFDDIANVVDFDLLDTVADNSGSSYLSFRRGLNSQGSVLYDDWIVKYSSEGDIQWSKQLPNGSIARQIQSDDNGNLYVLTEVLGRIQLQKYDFTGDLKSSINLFPFGIYSSDSFIELDGFGNIYVADDEGDIAKFNSAGEVLWTWSEQEFEASGFDELVGLAVDADGTVYLTGDFEQEGNSSRDDIFLVKLSKPSSPSLEFQDAVVEVLSGEDQTASIQFNIDLTGSTEPVILQYFTLDGTALAKDFNGISINSRQTLVAQPGANNRFSIQVYGDKPVNHATLETFARDVAYRDGLQKGQKVNQFPNSPDYGDLGYRVDAVFDGPNTGFQAVGLTADETFFTILTDPTKKVLKVDPNQGQRLLQALRGALGENYLLDPVWQQAVDAIAQLEQQEVAWTFSKGTIKDKGKPPVLATRGTEPNQVRDIYEDTNPQGIGFEQFSANRDRLRAWLDRVNSPTINPWITGHSLGGALAQWIASDYTSIGGQLGEVVTFNAPGISAQAASQFVRGSTTGGVIHYVTSGDWVSLAGQAFLPGRYILSDFNSASLGNTHLLPVLVPQVGPDRNRPLDTFIRISGIVNELGGLNDPRFNYIPDPNFFVQQLAVAALNPRLAAVLLSRFQVEQFRADLGRLAESAVFLNELAKPIYEDAYRAASRWGADAWNAIGDLSEQGWAALSQQTSNFWNATLNWTSTQWNAFKAIPSELWNGFTGAIDGLIDSILSLPTSVQQQFLQLISDANQDGISDRQQANITSLIPNENNPTAFLTLVSENGTVLENTEVQSPETLPSDTTLPLGVLDFDINTTAPTLRSFTASNAGITVDLLLQPDAQDEAYNSFWIYDTDWSKFTFDGETGAELLDTDNDGDIDQVKLHLIDGGRGDTDGVANGVIEVKGAIAITQGSNPPPPQTSSGLGGQKTFTIPLGNGTTTITNFGGVGKGDRPNQSTIAEVDTLAFEGEGLTARNLLLTQVGSDLEITFEGIDNTRVLLKDIALENLDNLLQRGSQSALANFRFDGESIAQDSVDIFDARANQGRVGKRNTVTFLNDRRNHVRGFDQSDDVINGQGGGDRLDGRSGDDLLRGRTGDDTLIGGNGYDHLLGNDGEDLLNGGSEDDTLNGGRGADAFIYATGRQFGSSDIGKDTIADFVSGVDKIVLDDDTFRALRSRKGRGFSIPDEFAIVNRDEDAATSRALIVYNAANGTLFYNENKTASGLGAGSLFATLSGAPTLVTLDFTIQS